jgi:heptosyltransferase-2
MCPKPAMDVILHRTLILRLSSIGDIVLSSPLIRALRRKFPEARIDYLLRDEYADLVQWNPHVSATFTFPRNGGWRELMEERRRIRESGYDLLIDIHDSLRSRVLTAGHRTVRIRKRKLARWLLVHGRRSSYARLGGAPSVPERYLETVAHLGVQDDGGGLDLYPPPEAADRVTRLLAETGTGTDARFVGVCPGARHATKRWPPERFGAVAAALAKERGWGVLIFGSEEERGLCSTVERTVREHAPDVSIINAAGRLALGDTAAAMDRCALVLTNDSGLMHIAAARSRPVVALFGSTVREFGFFPFRTPSSVQEIDGLACRPCTHIGRASCPQGHFRCMLDLSENRVLRAAGELLSSS